MSPAFGKRQQTFVPLLGRCQPGLPPDFRPCRCNLGHRQRSRAGFGELTCHVSQPSCRKAAAAGNVPPEWRAFPAMPASIPAGIQGGKARQTASRHAAVWENVPKRPRFLLWRGRLPAGIRCRLGRQRRIGCESETESRRGRRGNPRAFGASSMARMPSGAETGAGCRPWQKSRPVHGINRRCLRAGFQGRNGRRQRKKGRMAGVPARNAGVSGTQQGTLHCL